MIVLVLLSALPRDALWSPSSTAFSKSKIKLDSFGCICFWRSFKDRSLVRSSSSFVHDDSISRHTKHGSQKKIRGVTGAAGNHPNFMGLQINRPFWTLLRFVNQRDFTLECSGRTFWGKFCTLVFAHPGRAILRGITNSPGNNLFCCWELVFFLNWGNLWSSRKRLDKVRSHSFKLLPTCTCGT